MEVLLSIKPEFAEKIFSGVKRFEYRRVLFKKPVKKIILYSSSPTQRIVGEFSIKRIIEGHPSYVWSQTKQFSGISETFYREYFDGKERAYAIEVGQTIKYDCVIDPYKEFKSFVPPQSFRYLVQNSLQPLMQFCLS